jgi:RNA 2',3'-cyclic 3'-phosphodiesterase
MHRLFVAVDLPEETKMAVSRICTGVPGAKWVDPSQIHLTLRFIGGVDDTLFERMRSDLSGIVSSPFTLVVGGVGRFPQKRDPQVLWVGLERNDALVRLRDLVEQAVVKCGLEPEGRGFSPHITVARLNNPQLSSVAAFLEKNSRFAVSPVHITEFHLYSSTLTPRGAIHRRESTYQLTQLQP